MQKLRNYSTRIIIALMVMVCMVLTLPIANNTNTVSAADTTKHVHGVVNYAGTVNSKLNVTASGKSKSDDQGTIAFRISNTTAYVVYTKLGTASSTSSVQTDSLNFYPFNFTTYSNATNDFVSRHEMICKTMATRTSNFAGTWYVCVIKDENYSIAVFVNGGDDSKTPFADFVNMDKGITSLKKGYCYTTVNASDKSSCQTLNNYLTPVAEKTVTTNIEDYYYDATGTKIKRADATTTMGKKFKNASYTVTYSKGNAYWGDAEATSMVMAKSYAKFNFKIAPGTGGNMTIPVEFHSQLVKTGMPATTAPTCKQTGSIDVSKNYITKANDTLSITGIKNLANHASSTYTYVKGSKDGTHTAKYSCCGEVYKADVACTYKTTTAPTCTSDGVETCSICGQTRKLTKLGHDFSDGHHEEIPALCETNGTKEYWTCSRCKKNSLTNDVNTTSYASDYNLTIPKLGHDYSAEKAEEMYRRTNHTCIADATYYYACSHEGCDKFTKTAYWSNSEGDDAKTGHEYSYETITEPTCTTTGVSKGTCTNEWCKSTDNGHTVTEIIPAKGHDWSEHHEEVPATCETNGTKEYWVCSDCGKMSLTDDKDTTNYVTATQLVIPKLGHDYTAMIPDDMYRKSEATCLSPAKYYFACTHEGCEHPIGKTVWENDAEPPTGHSYLQYDEDWKVTKEPTCTTSGKKIGTCRWCSASTEGHTKSEIIDALGHEDDGEYTFVGGKKPTCTEDGEECSHCTRCKVVTDRQIVEALGHDDDYNWEITKEPTCEKAGSKCTHCTRCNAVVQTEVIDALGHEDDGNWVVVKKATCGEEGRKCTHCVNCKQEIEGVTQSEVIPKDPSQHAWVVKKVTKQATCVEDGHQDMICTHCGTPLTTDFAEYAEETTIPKTGKHTRSSWIVDKEATTSAKGSKHIECTVCHEVLDTADIPVKDVNMSGTKYTNTKNVKKANLKKGMFVYVGISGTNYGVGYKILSVTSTGGTVMYMSYNNKNAKTVTVPNVVKIGTVPFKVTAISKDAFKNNKNLTKVVIGKNVATIGSNAFMGCTALSTVTLGAGVKNIQSNAFNGCIKLARITFGANVTTLGAGSFNGCKNLKTITFNTKKLGTVGKNSFKNIKANATITVPSAKLKLYSNKLKASSTLSKNVKFLGR